MHTSVSIALVYARAHKEWTGVLVYMHIWCVYQCRFIWVRRPTHIDVDMSAQTRLQWARWAWSCPTHRTLLAMHPSWLTVAGRKMLRVATPLHTACRVSGCSDLDDKVWMPAGPAGCNVMESTGAQGGFPLQTGHAAFPLWTCEATWSHPCRMSWRSTGLLKSTLWRKWCHRWAAIRRWAFLS